MGRGIVRTGDFALLIFYLWQKIYEKKNESIGYYLTFVNNDRPGDEEELET